jgi:hypothetical protein
MKNKIVVYKRSFKSNVSPSDVQPDIAKAKIAAGRLTVEPLIDWGGVGFFFNTQPDIEYTIKFGINPRTTASIDQFQITSSDNPTLEADLNHYPATIVSPGVSEFKHKKQYNGFLKFYYKHVERPQQSSLQHIFEIDFVEISIEDPNQDFSKVTSENYKFILQNLKTNYDELVMALLDRDLETNHLDNVEKIDKIKAIEELYNIIHTGFSNPIDEQLALLNLEI